MNYWKHHLKLHINNMGNVNVELEDDDYYDKFIEEISPRTNYGQT